MEPWTGNPEHLKADRSATDTWQLVNPDIRAPRKTFWKKQKKKTCKWKQTTGDDVGDTREEEVSHHARHAEGLRVSSSGIWTAGQLTVGRGDVLAEDAADVGICRHSEQTKKQTKAQAFTARGHPG